jgi:hypothetical protein
MAGGFSEIPAVTIAVAVTKRTSTFNKLKHDTDKLIEPFNMPCLLDAQCQGAKKVNVYTGICK